MFIGQLAKACDVGKDTVHHYERLGLIYSSEHQAGLLALSVIQL